MALLTEEEMERQEKLHMNPQFENPYYFKQFWEGYKGLVKGMLGGLVAGVVTGAPLGVGLGAIAFLALGPAAPALAVMIGAGALIGALAGGIFGLEEFKDVGRGAGTAAAGNEIQERRILKGIALIQEQATGKKIEVPTSKDLDNCDPTIVDSPHRTNSPHYNSSSSFNGKLYHWKTGLPGALIGVGFGALLASSLLFPPAAAAIGSVIGLHVLAVEGIAATSAAITAMGAFGLFGATFGIERNLYRHLFDFTDRIFAGENPFPPKEPIEVRRAIAQSKEIAKSIEQERPAKQWGPGVLAEQQRARSESLSK